MVASGKFFLERWYDKNARMEVIDVYDSEGRQVYEDYVKLVDLDHVLNMVRTKFDITREKRLDQ